MTTDAGWGCTIRAGQMMLLNTLKRHYSYEDNFSLLETIQENLMTAPFSVHKITEIGAEFDKNPGDWYSPSTICHSIEKLTKIREISGFKAKVFMDSIIYIDQILKEVLNEPIDLSTCTEQDAACSLCFETFQNYE